MDTDEDGWDVDVVDKGVRSAKDEAKDIHGGKDAGGVVSKDIDGVNSFHHCVSTFSIT